MKALRRAFLSALASSLMLALPAVVQAQFNFTTNNGAITITGYTGLGGDVVIPAETNGLPVTRIGTNAFQLSTNLKRVTIPDSVTNIGELAFFNCADLSAITVDTNNPTYSSVNGVLFNKDQTTLIECPAGKTGSYTVPSTVTGIEGSAFVGCGLTNVTIPNSVISIGNRAFWACASLTNITLSESITSIGEGTFASCSRLTSATVPNSVTYIGSLAFYGCFSLTNVTIGNSVSNIGDSAFASCRSLTHITIPDNVTNIQIYAFYYCTSLTNVTIGTNVASIGIGAFCSCSNLTRVTIPNRVTTIGNYAFQWCTSLTGLFFKGKAPSAGSSVFDGVTNATVYYLPGTTGWTNSFAGCPAVLWNPSFQTTNASFGVRTNGFGLPITGTTNIPIVVEACTNLVSPVWIPLQSCTLTNGSIYFSDSDWTNYPGRFYRLRSP
jgi:hypothetical protein